MNWLKRLLGQKQPPTRVTTLSDGLVIRTPRLRFLNLAGPSARAQLATDKAALDQLFRDSGELDTIEPCDVLMLYCTVEDDGRSLKHIVEASQAPVVVVASENAGDAYVKASASEPHKYTNLVMTIDRNGSRFEHFYRALFGKMFEGKTMPVAWVELAPQIPGGSHADAPETIFACGAGHVRFEA
jgi:hypothetical protein